MFDKTMQILDHKKLTNFFFSLVAKTVHFFKRKRNNDGLIMHYILNNRPLKTVWPDCKANSKLKRKG